MTENQSSPETEDWRIRQQREREAQWSRILETPRGRRKAWLDMMLSDHGILRVLTPNRHRIGAAAWRSAQPSPGQIEWFAQQGGRTVISLRGGKLFGSLPLEEEACRKHGLTFIVQRLYSRDLPSSEDLQAFIALIRSVEAPVLYHCKSGADRAGFAAVLHMHLVEGAPMDEAIKQLSFKYLHIKAAKTGVLDAMFETYMARAAETGIGFEDWVAREYDPVAIKARFLAEQRTPLAFLVDKILRRE